MPLVMMAELARWQGHDWYGHQNHRLELLVNRVIGGINDSAFRAKSGHKQLEVPARPLGWLSYGKQQCRGPQAIAAILKSAGSP